MYIYTNITNTIKMLYVHIDCYHWWCTRCQISKEHTHQAIRLSLSCMKKLSDEHCPHQLIHMKKVEHGANFYFIVRVDI